MLWSLEVCRMIYKIMFKYEGSVIVLVLTSLIAASYAYIPRSNNPCSLGVRYWCKNEDNARECGVIDFCHERDLLPKRKAGFSPDTSPVVIGFYYESLCSGCHYMFKQSVMPAYQKLNSTGIVKFEIVPYGNARETQIDGQWKFKCQHGAPECLGNLIETCAIGLLKGIADYLPFVYCMEMQTFNIFTTEDVNKVATTCAQQHSVPLDEINKCALGAQGNSLEHEMAVKTDALNPQHTFVPWITVDGVHTDAIQKEAWGNMLKLICNSYKGTKPTECNQPEFEPTVCYNEL